MKIIRNIKISDVLKGKSELLKLKLMESVASDDFNAKNIDFDEEIDGLLYVYYPLDVVVENEIKFHTLYELITAIRETYMRIYEEEEESMTKIEDTPSLYNRGISNGKYGIWGHSIYDLYIENITIYSGESKPLIDLFIGS